MLLCKINKNELKYDVHSQLNSTFSTASVEKTQCQMFSAHFTSGSLSTQHCVFLINNCAICSQPDPRPVCVCAVTLLDAASVKQRGERSVPNPAAINSLLSLLYCLQPRVCCSEQIAASRGLDFIPIPLCLLAGGKGTRSFMLSLKQTCSDLSHRHTLSWAPTGIVLSPLQPSVAAPHHRQMLLCVKRPQPVNSGHRQSAYMER